MTLLKWCFPVAILACCGSLLLISAFSPHPAVTRASLEQNFRLAAAPFRQAAEPVDLLTDAALAQEGVRLLFPQIGDGLLPGTDRFMQSSLILVNTTGRATEGHVQFYNDVGNPLEVTIDGVTASRFDFSLIGTELKRLITSGQGELVTGWAEVYSEQPLVGTVTFGIRDGEGTVYTDVGVAPSPGGREFTLFADTIGWTNTGIALSNPSTTDTIQIDLKLRDLSGNSISVETFDLPPLGHRARFLNELFAETSGIDDFEGSVVIESDNVFAGITLRTWGELLTSMPMVAPVSEEAEWTRLAFPHVGDGRTAGLKISTSVILFNNTQQRITGHVDFYRSDASGMNLRVGSVTGATFDFDLPAGAVTRLSTAPGQELQTGWAEVVADGPLAGTALYAIFDDGSQLLSEVGVEAAYLYSQFDLIADSMGSSNTGVAVANPAPSGSPIRVSFELKNRWGYFEWRVFRDIPPKSHLALFITELFPEMENIDEFEGILSVSAGTGYYDDEAVWVAPVCLRQTGTKLTSLPTLARQYGFAPNSEVGLGQTLSGTSPPVYWRISQRSGEFAISKADLQLPGVKIHEDQLKEFAGFAQGYVTGSSSDRVLSFFSEEEDKTRFQVTGADHLGSTTFGEGRFYIPPGGGVGIELQYLQESSYSLIGADGEFFVQFPPGLLEIAEGLPSLEPVAEFTSVSASQWEERPLLRRQAQVIPLQPPQEDAPNLHSIDPVNLTRENLATVRGTNFGEAPKLYVRTWGGNRESIDPVWASDSEMEVYLPARLLGNAEIQVQRADDYRSNRYQPHFPFSPTVQMELLQTDSSLDELHWHILSLGTRYQHVVPTHFILRLFDADCDFSKLATGEELGSVARSDDYTSRSLFVNSVSEGEAVLTMCPSYDPNQIQGTLTIERATGEWTGLLLTFKPAETWYDRMDLRYGLTWDWTLAGVPLAFSDPSGIQRALLRMYPFAPERGAEEVEQMVVFAPEPGP